MAIAAWLHLSDLILDITVLEEFTLRTLPESSLVLHFNSSILMWPYFRTFKKKEKSTILNFLSVCLFVGWFPLLLLM